MIKLSECGWFNWCGRFFDAANDRRVRPSSRLSAVTLGLLTSVTVFAAAGEAHATVSFVDNLEKTTVNGGWSFYSTKPSRMDISYGAWSGARSPSHVISIGSDSGGTSTSDWQMAWKTFEFASVRFPIVGCRAEVWILPFQPATGQLEMVDTVNSTYIGIKAFNLPANGVYNRITLTNRWACSHRIDVRVVLYGGVPRGQSIAFDDVTLTYIQ